MLAHWIHRVHLAYRQRAWQETLSADLVRSCQEAAGFQATLEELVDAIILEGLRLSVHPMQRRPPDDCHWDLGRNVVASHRFFALVCMLEAAGHPIEGPEQLSRLMEVIGPASLVQAGVGRAATQLVIAHRIFAPCWQYLGQPDESYEDRLVRLAETHLGSDGASSSWQDVLFWFGITETWSPLNQPSRKRQRLDVWETIAIQE